MAAEIRIPTAAMWIAGEAVEQTAAEPYPVTDPARGRVIAHWPEATGREVDRAVAAAREAFAAGHWRDAEPVQRGRALLELARRIREHAAELAALDSLNVGKPLGQALGDVETAAAFFENYGQLAVDHPGEVVEYTASQVSLVVREPVGVVAAIIPWNFPVTVAAAAAGAPLAAGNSVILKPSELTPLSAVRLAELAADLFPPGVFSVVTGTGRGAGARLGAHRDVDTILFTGSVAVGTGLMATAAAEVKRIDLELGGKSPTIVFADAPFDAAVESALTRIVLAQGENCAAGSRLLVEASIRDRFIEALVERARTLTIGDPSAPGTDLGPMISAAHRDRVRSYMAAAEREARCIHLGPTPSEPPFDAGYYVPLSVWEAGPGTVIWREEVFGPLLAVQTFRAEAEAIALANDTDYGLMAVVWCGDTARALNVARRVRAGIVRVNGAGSPVNGPWGGFGKSGIGRNYGKYGIAASTELKQINLPIGGA